MMQYTLDRQLPQHDLEEHLLDLRESSVLAWSHYAEDDDSVTGVLQVPEDAAEWWVAVNARSPRSLTARQIHRGLAHGQLHPDMPVWREGLPAWQPLGDVAELRSPAESGPAELRSPAESGTAELRSAAPAAAPARLPSPSPARTPVEASTPANAAPPPHESSPRESKAAAAPDSLPAVVAELQPLVPPDIDLERLALETGSLRMKRAVMAVSALAMTGVFVTLFAISSTSEDKVRDTATQREAPVRVKAPAPERTAAPGRASDEPLEEGEDEPQPRQRARERARGVPREAAAMMMSPDEPEPAEGASRDSAPHRARQRL